MNLLSKSEVAAKEQALQAIGLTLQDFELLEAVNSEWGRGEFAEEEIERAKINRFITEEAGRFELTFSGRKTLQAAQTLIRGQLGIGRVIPIKKRAQTA